MKICIYAIAKDEIKNTERFIKNLKEADEVVVADTGSTDGTVEKLRSLGARVESVSVNPWRFDEALNKALALVPTDATVAMRMDLDEVPDPGWRKEIEKAYTPSVKMMKANYIWSHLPNGDTDLAFMSTRIHIPNQFKWVLPTHECLHYIGPAGEYQEKNTGVVIHHWPDALKPRPDDLPLLEMGVREDPGSQRASFYLAREYYFRQKYSEAKVEFQRYLTLSHWSSERAKAMRTLASIAMIENNRPEQLKWLSLATVEAPKEREAWVELAQFHHDDKNYIGGYQAAKHALSITQRTDFFTEAFAWGSLPYDLAGTCAYYIGLQDEFVSLTTQALQLDPANERLQNNLKLFAHKVSS